jgi:hypothetical protein
MNKKFLVKYLIVISVLIAGIFALNVSARILERSITSNQVEVAMSQFDSNANGYEDMTLINEARNSIETFHDAFTVVAIISAIVLFAFWVRKDYKQYVFWKKNQEDFE